jgi:hypothetical protein
MAIIYNVHALRMKKERITKNILKMNLSIKHQRGRLSVRWEQYVRKNVIPKQRARTREEIGPVIT